jgi:Tol biopolymer transport system component
MRLARSRAVIGAILAMTVAAVIGFATSAQANTTIPGLNGKILFTTDRDTPFVLPPASAQRGGEPSCDFGESCADELYSMNPDGSSPTRLTNNSVFDDNGAWLPADGSKVAFEETSVGDTTGDDIWSMNGDGSSPVQLTTDEFDEDNPTYSPDGTRIAFASDASATPSTAADRLGTLFEDTQIMVMPAGGEAAGTPTPLLPPEQLGTDGTVTHDFDPAWSPDGTKIAFTRVTFTGLGVPSPDRLVFFATADERTYIAPADGSGPATPVETYPACDVEFPFSASRLSVKRAQSRLIPLGACTSDLKPAWSPDGTKLAVIRETENGVSTGAATRLVDTTNDPGDIVVIPVSNPAGEVDVSDVTEPSDCTPSAGASSDSTSCSDDKDPTWSPDGTKIAFDSNRTADGTASPTDQCNSQTDGSPTGNCDYEIWTMNADGTGLTQVTNNVFQDTDPDWQRIPPPPVQPPAPPATPATPPKIGVAGVRRACVSSSFHVRFHVATSSSVKSVVVKLDGKRIKSTTRSSFTLSINGKKLKAGRHRLTITATDSAGHVTTTHKSFSVCKAAKPRKKAAPRFTG